MPRTVDVLVWIVKSSIRSVLLLQYCQDLMILNILGRVSCLDLRVAVGTELLIVREDISNAILAEGMSAVW